jgi:3-hydroxyacyl-[acyl-carrier-protein] dehydratase
VASDSSQRAEIEARIPHRDPFLFVDAIIDQSADSIQTRWTVPVDMDVFRGHFPARPVLPGVLICEYAFQSAALIVYAQDDAPNDARAPRGTPVLTKIEESRFKHIVAPGDTLTADVKLNDRLQNACYFSAKVHSQAGLVARLAFVLALIPAEAPA